MHLSITLFLNNFGKNKDIQIQKRTVEQVTPVHKFLYVLLKSPEHGLHGHVHPFVTIFLSQKVIMRHYPQHK